MYKNPSIWGLLLSISLLFSCSKEEKIVLRGKAQGTTYQISYFDSENRSFQKDIDSIFNAVDLSMSTYLDHSIISNWNSNKSTEVDYLFQQVFKSSLQVYTESNGFFDPTVGPLIQLYGFGKSNEISITEEKRDSILTFVGMDKIQLQENKLIKKDPRIALNFNAIAQGYTVDLIRNHLQNKGLQSFMVEVGGELYCEGYKPDGTNWIIAIDKPEKERNVDFQEYIQLKNEAIATSGNYRKVQTQESTGEQYVHTINPLTGEAKMSALISVTIIHKDCMFADAYATAILSMGMEKGIQFLKANPRIKAYLIYHNGENFETITMNNFDQSILDAI